MLELKLMLESEFGQEVKLMSLRHFIRARNRGHHRMRQSVISGKVPRSFALYVPTGIDILFPEKIL